MTARQSEYNTFATADLLTGCLWHPHRNTEQEKNPSVAIEIERKFLMASEGWRPGVVRTKIIVDGLLMSADGRKLRVRLCDGQATLTFKGRRDGFQREEVELPMDLSQAQILLEQHCDGRVLSKKRHLVPQGDLVWEIDEYDTPLDGVVLAEIELPSADHRVDLPDWIGQEVSGDPRWQKLNLLAARQDGG
jgi:CYTH domain-containing protein